MREEATHLSLLLGCVSGKSVSGGEMAHIVVFFAKVRQRGTIAPVLRHTHEPRLGCSSPSNKLLCVGSSDVPPSFHSRDRNSCRHLAAGTAIISRQAAVVTIVLWHVGWPQASGLDRCSIFAVRLRSDACRHIPPVRSYVPPLW